MQRFEFIASMIEKYGFQNGVEIGVKSGRTTCFLLNRFPDLKMTAVDPWVKQSDVQHTAEGVEKSYNHDNHHKWEARFRNNTKRFFDNKRLKIFKDFSHNVAPKMRDDHFDFIFIDGMHTYEGCKQDILDWRPKVRQGGLLCGHDANWPEVTRAVRECEPYFNISLGDNVWWSIKREAPTSHHNILLNKDDVIFMLSAKCASRSIKTLIRDGLGYRKPKSAMEGLNFISKEKALSPEYADYLKIAIVRNPFARLVSCYLDKVLRAFRPGIKYLGVKEGASFGDFLQVACNTPDELSDPHFVSQSSMLLDDAGNMIPDLIYRMEDKQGAWHGIQKSFHEKAGRPLPQLEHLNKSRTQVDYRSFYTPELIEMVRARFKDDIERLGYEF